MTLASIRQGIVTILRAANTAAGQRVYDSRVWNVQGAELPCLVVRTVDVSDDNVSIGVPMFRRVLRVAIDGYVAGAVDATLSADGDSLFEAVSAALYQNAAWVQQFEKIQRVVAEFGHDAEGNARRGGFSLGLSLQYVVVFEPDVEDEFETVELDTQFTLQFPGGA